MFPVYVIACDLEKFFTFDNKIYCKLASIRRVTDGQTDIQIDDDSIYRVSIAARDKN